MLLPDGLGGLDGDVCPERPRPGRAGGRRIDARRQDADVAEVMTQSAARRLLTASLRGSGFALDGRRSRIGGGIGVSSVDILEVPERRLDVPPALDAQMTAHLVRSIDTSVRLRLSRIDSGAVGSIPTRAPARLALLNPH